MEDIKTDPKHGDKGGTKEVYLPLLSLAAFLLSLLALLLLLLLHHLLAGVALLASFLLVILWQEEGRVKEEVEEQGNRGGLEEVEVT